MLCPSFQINVPTINITYKVQDIFCIFAFIGHNTGPISWGTITSEDSSLVIVPHWGSIMKEDNFMITCATSCWEGVWLQLIEGATFWKLFLFLLLLIADWTCFVTNKSTDYFFKWLLHQLSFNLWQRRGPLVVQIDQIEWRAWSNILKYWGTNLLALAKICLW